MILYDPSRMATLAERDTDNNPVLLWNNIIDSYTAPDGTETGGPIANLSSTATAKYVYPTENSGTWRIEFTASDSITIAAIASHNLATVGATVSLESWNGASWDDSGAGSVAPSDNEAIAWRIVAADPAKWSIKITGASAQPAFAILYAGQETVVPVRIYQGYAPPIRPNNVRLQANVSDGGHYLGAAKVAAGSSVAASFEHIEAETIRGTEFTGFFDHFNDGAPFFWAWRPAKYGDLFYAWRAGSEIQPTNSGPQDRMGFGIEMRVHHDP